MEAASPRSGLAHRAQPPIDGVLRDPNGHLLLLAGRIGEDVLRIHFEPTPHVRPGRSLEIIRLRLAEGKEFRGRAAFRRRPRLRRLMKLGRRWNAALPWLIKNAARI